MLFEGYLFQMIGGFARFLYGKFIRKLGFRKDTEYSIKEYLYGPKIKGDIVFDGMGHAFINKLVGMLFIIIMILSLVVFLR